MALLISLVSPASAKAGGGRPPGWRSDRGERRACDEVVGAEVLEMVDDKIKEIRDYHTRVRAAVADSASVAEAVP